MFTFFFPSTRFIFITLFLYLVGKTFSRVCFGETRVWDESTSYSSNTSIEFTSLSVFVYVRQVNKLVSPRIFLHNIRTTSLPLGIAGSFYGWRRNGVVTVSFCMACEVAGICSLTLFIMYLYREEMFPYLVQYYHYYHVFMIWR